MKSWNLKHQYTFDRCHKELQLLLLSFFAQTISYRNVRRAVSPGESRVIKPDCSFQALSCFLHVALVSLVESPHFLFIKMENKGAKDPFEANGHIEI